ncbi:group II truncated hemoglobin [Paracoccus pacificus]|uniref:Group II truncated hemoglobin n=1 Tax=Paracoccus pacificus TaxID=1463598 RepID=A0ABW4RB06_9RHOB
MQPTAAILDRIGGAATLRGVVARFYDLIETDPRGARILQMHLRGHGLSHVRAEQFDFMSGFLGGPRLYAERHGHMNLREIHDHVPIRSRDAEDWLALMDRALDEAGIDDAEALERIRATLRRAALMLVNTSDDITHLPDRPTRS